MALFGIAFQFLSAAQMYIKDEANPESFSTTADNFSDARYTVGVTIMSYDDSGTESWELPAEKLNPVIWLDANKIAEMGIPVSVGEYAREVLNTVDNTSTWVRMSENPDADAQYKGPPLFMDFKSFASHSSDYKDDVYQNGEVVSQYFPIIDIEQFNESGGANFETWWRISSESDWNKCETINDGPNGAVTDPYQIYGDLNDSYPVQNTWDAKTDLGTDFNENIVVRIRAKYGIEAFASAPAPHSDGGGSTPSAQFELDSTDAMGVTGYSYYDDSPGSPDVDNYSDPIAKRDDILSTYGLTGVGSYDDGVQTYPVYDFQGMESARDAFVPGLTGRYYAINDTSLVAVQPAGTGGAN